MGFTKGQKKNTKKGTSGEKGTPWKEVGTNDDDRAGDQSQKRTRSTTPKRGNAEREAKGRDQSRSNKRTKHTECGDTEDDSATRGATVAEKCEYNRLVRNIYNSGLIFCPL